jgi:peptidoglycan-associated lipoprotein
MIKKIISTVMCSVLLLGCMTACQRSGREVWEDTKTASRHVGKGVKSLGGKHGDSRQISSMDDFEGPQEEEYIPLNDEDIYRKITLGDASALEKINQDSAIPQSREAPGDMGSAIPGIGGFSDPTALSLENIFSNVHFETNRYLIKGRENLNIVDKVARYMKENPSAYIFVEGHCDERGAAAYNLSLGAKRSNSIRNLLIKGGIDLNRVFTISYGKERPLIQNAGSKSLAKNRRAQFKLYYR